MPVVVCALCGERRAKRACPALDRWICPVCCGTKRLVQINCPKDCAYLAAAREHPPVAEVRRQERDVELIAPCVRGLTEEQARLFVAVGSFLVQYQAPGLQAPVDDDVGQAAEALAATLETSARGVIYERRPASLPAERLAAGLKALLVEAGSGSAFERDAAVVLRRLAEAARSLRGAESADDGRPFLSLLGRVLRRPDSGPEPPPELAAEPRIIIP
jgi:hypothetical protein